MTNLIAILRIPLQWIATHWKEGFYPATWSNWALVVVGAAAAWAALKTLRAIDAQVTIAKRTLVLQNRPRLIVRSVLAKTQTIQRASGEREQVWLIRYTIINKGGSTAHIFKLVSGADCFTVGELPAEPPYGELSINLTEKSLEPGEHADYEIEMTNEVLYNFRRYFQTNNKYLLDTTHFIGYLRFRDDADVMRSLGFLRKFNSTSDRFTVVNDPEYEYAD